MQFTITIPDTLTFTTRGERIAVTLMTEFLTDAIVAQATVHGFKQKIVDAAASAVNQACIAVAGNKTDAESKDAYLARLRAVATVIPMADVDAEALRLMTKVRDNLVAGDWGADRSAGPGLDTALVDFVMSRFEAAFTAQLDGFKVAKKPERRTMVNVWLDAKTDRRAKYAAELAAERAKVATIDLDDM